MRLSTYIFLAKQVGNLNSQTTLISLLVKEDKMKATFSQPVNVIETAARRGGLILTFAEPEQNGQIQVIPGPAMSSAIADANTIMRLIGALADDGQECLISVN